jgi:hypothetical protein
MLINRDRLAIAVDVGLATRRGVRAVKVEAAVWAVIGATHEPGDLRSGLARSEDL